MLNVPTHLDKKYEKKRIFDTVNFVIFIYRF